MVGWGTEVGCAERAKGKEGEEGRLQPHKIYFYGMPRTTVSLCTYLSTFILIFFIFLFFLFFYFETIHIHSNGFILNNLLFFSFSSSFFIVM